MTAVGELPEADNETLEDEADAASVARICSLVITSPVASQCLKLVATSAAVW